MLARNKHSSLLWKFVTYGHKKFYNIGSRNEHLKYECQSVSIVELKAWIDLQELNSILKLVLVTIVEENTWQVLVLSDITLKIQVLIYL
jgi:hypothetical protein